MRSFVAAALCALVSLCFPTAFAQQKKISDGIYTAEQARRGRAEYDQTCSRCHNLVLTGTERGPAIKGSDFLSHWDKDTVAGLFIKIRDTMPQGRLGIISEEAKIDILSYILQQNGFPEGVGELKNDLSLLGDFPLGAETSGVPNFALVQVIGCLTQSPNGRWNLTNSTEPAVTKDESSTPDALKAAAGRSLGTETFELVSVTPSFRPESHKGSRMEARGLLYREANNGELNLTSLEMVASKCGSIE
ncbi:MAG: cytochrome c [Acidobacteria bacterium]|nr:cytochrome c [Acidobacteriota bacterium]